MSSQQPGANKRIAITLVSVVAVMLGLSFAAVPLYDLYCRVTGFGGTTQRADSGSDRIVDQTILVHFDANVAQGMDWHFKPMQTSQRLKIGETGLAFYEAHNPTDKPITGTATFNVAPFNAGAYFTKIDCFCFTEQILQPGQTVTMPVSYYIDPEILEDDEANGTQVITLSYTFFKTEPSASDSDGGSQTPQS